MAAPSNQTTQIQAWLDRLLAGDDHAREDLIQCACARLERLTRKMLQSWQGVHRWEDTGDVMQNALLRLYRSLSETRPPSVADFFRLAALHIRRELHDLAKHYYGPEGLGANHATWRAGDDQSADPMARQPGRDDDDPGNLAAWAEFHAQVERLPDDDREMFDLLWYQQLSQAETARLLGISRRTVKRRWAAARLRLSRILKETLPLGEVHCRVNRPAAVCCGGGHE